MGEAGNAKELCSAADGDASAAFVRGLGRAVVENNDADEAEYVDVTAWEGLEKIVGAGGRVVDIENAENEDASEEDETEDDDEAILLITHASIRDALKSVRKEQSVSRSCCC
jgi:hypothetical protein